MENVTPADLRQMGYKTAKEVAEELLKNPDEFVVRIVPAFDMPGSSTPFPAFPFAGREIQGIKVTVISTPDPKG